MRSPALWMSTLSLALMGCPEMHRPGGYLDKAAHKDALENIPERCDSELREELCGDGKENSRACIERCGG